MSHNKYKIAWGNSGTHLASSALPSYYERLMFSCGIDCIFVKFRKPLKILQFESLQYLQICSPYDFPVYFILITYSFPILDRILITPPLGRRGGMDRACRRESGGMGILRQKFQIRPAPWAPRHWSPTQLGNMPGPKMHKNQYKTIRNGSPRAETLGNWSQWSE